MEHLGINMFFWHNYVLIFLSFFICTVLIALAPRAPRLAGQDDHTCAVQSMHVRRTARVGGLAIFLSIVVSIFFAPDAIAGPYAYLILASLILFLAGIFEDLGFGVSPRDRLIATAVASLAVMFFFKLWLPRVEIPGLDMVMWHWAIGIPVTLLITAGVANAFNMVDGVNGLSSLSAMTAALTLAYIAQKSGYADIVPLAIMLASTVLGFFLLNYPFGLIFLGDGGAYVLGFILSWLGIFIIANAPDVSPWAIVLTMFWPIADMVLSIYRRSKRKKATTAPDRLHAHQMVMRTLESHFLGRGRRGLANPLTTLILAPFVIVPALTGVLLWDQPSAAFLAVVFFSVVFVLSYSYARPIVRRLKRRVQLVVTHS